MSKRNRDKRNERRTGIPTGDAGRSVTDGRHLLTSLGEASPAGGFADLPPKIPGQHRWFATAGYTLTASQAAAADNGARIVLGPETLVAFGVGCWDCELEYRGARLEPCTALADELVADAVGAGRTAIRFELSPDVAVAFLEGDDDVRASLTTAALDQAARKGIPGDLIRLDVEGTKGIAVFELAAGNG
jgi:hypothetical protein